MSSVQQLVRSGIILNFLAVLTGLLIAAAKEKPNLLFYESTIASHLSAFLGAFWIFALAWTIHAGFVKQSKVLTIATLWANYSNWFLNAAKSFFGGRGFGVGITHETINNTFVLLLTINVVIPSLIGSYLWYANFLVPKNQRVTN
jgi:hypothetical protein